MLVSRGHFAVESGDPQQGLALLQGARHELSQAAVPESAHAWLAAFHADAYAQLGDRTATHVELRKAESLAGGEYHWPWVRSFEKAVPGYQASTLAKLDDLPAARTAFAAAVPGMAPKPLAEAEADHARVLAHTGHVDEACALAVAALKVARQYGSERIVRRIGALRAELPAGTRVTAALDDALSWNAM
jgi:hypothetical protein